MQSRLYGASGARCARHHRRADQSHGPSVFWVLAIFTNITVISRMIYTWQEAKGLEDAQLRSPVFPARMSLQLSAGSGQRQLPVLHAFRADQCVRDLLDVPCLSLHDQHLQAVIVVQMNVYASTGCSCDDRAVCRSAFRSAFVRDGRRPASPSQQHLPRSDSHDFLHEFLANQIAERLRPVRITSLPDQTVELHQ